MIGKFACILAATVALTHLGTPARAESQPTEVVESGRDKKAKIKAKRAARKLKRLARQGLTLESPVAITPATVEAGAVPAEAREPAPAGRPARPKPVIVPPTPPAPAPVFSER